MYVKWRIFTYTRKVYLRTFQATIPQPNKLLLTKKQDITFFLQRIAFYNKMEYFPEDTDEAKQEFDQFIKEEWPYDGKPQLDDTKQIAVAQRHNMSTQDRIDNIEEYRNVWAEYLDTIVYDASLNSYIDIHCPDNNT